MQINLQTQILMITFLMTPVLKRNLKFNKYFASKIIYEDLCDFHKFIRHNLKCTKKSVEYVLHVFFEKLEKI